MDRTRTNQAFIFVGNHPCLDFINTQIIVRDHMTDLLEAFDDLVAWLIQAKCMTKGEGESVTGGLSNRQKEGVLQRARTFRAMLREMVENIARRKAIPANAIIEINRLLSQGPGYPQIFKRAGGFQQTVVSKALPEDSLLIPLAKAASDLLCKRNPAFVKKCRNAACILYFYDTTKNHRRNWCSMQVCGNRVKVAAHYRRKRLVKGKTG